MATLSIGDAWEGASAFLKREWKLLLPVSLAFVGMPGLVTELLGPKIDPANLGTMSSSQLMPWLFGMSLIGLFGQLAINILVLVPGVSVGEALSRAIHRFPILLAAVLVAMGAGLAAMVLLTTFLSLGGKAGAALGVGMAMAGGFVLALRLMVTHVVVVAEPVGPVQALRRSWQLTGDHALKLLGFCALAFFALIAISVVVAALGSVLTIFDALGGPGISATASGVLGAFVNSITTMIFTVVTVFLYRQLAGSNSGT
ncbi:glycerophosphoryl diester phosphodiesterase membrane domain-containing protein [Flavisphingomonas formosensis]|uniref:glycerophosphoryl diester phosphodiesterase membrane domain-containing protein n=1 Tax=Flavisphingomonas formosensis TaxID=861534 RepID=UPI0012F97940|nr:glycerophosphoryl diester phosphodiesterase membrane domain-containing protein [Sphingomonas formosensis]